MFRLLIACLCSVLIGSGSMVCAQKYRPDPDSVKRWKQEAEWYYNQGRLEQAHDKFIRLTNYYLNSDDTTRAMDYLHKGFRCIVNLDPNKSILEFNELLRLSQNSTVKDTILFKAIIDSFENNYDIFQTITNTNALIDSLITIITNKQNNSLLKRLYLFNIRISLAKNQFFRLYSLYYKLIQLDSSRISKYNSLLELSEIYQNNNDYVLSNVVLFNILNKFSLSDTEKSIVYNLIGNNYIYLKLPELSFPFYDTSKQLRELKGSSEDLRVIFNNLGNYYKQVNQFDSTLVFYNRALILALSTFGHNSRESAFEYNNLGNYYFDIGNIDSALINYAKSLNINSLNTFKPHQDIVHSLYNVGLCYFYKNDYDSSLYYLYNSIKFNQNNYLYKVKPPNSFSIKDMIFSYEIIGDIYVSKSIDDPLKAKSYLDSAKYFYYHSLTYADSLISYSPLEFTQLQINEYYFNIIEKASRCYTSVLGNNTTTKQDLIQLTTIFDRCHNYILRNTNNSSFNNNFSFYNSYNQSSKMLTKIKLLEAKQPFPLDSIKKVSANIFDNVSNNEILYNNTQLAQFHSLSANHLKTYLQNIPPRTIIIEYTRSKDSIFSVILTNEQINIINIGEADNIIKLMNDCRNNIKKIETDNNSLLLLSKALLPQLKKFTESNLDLIIIPDVSLQGFPFELLILDDQITSNQKLLISRFNAIYAPSITELTINNSFDATTYNYDFIGFAPGYFTNYTNNWLPDLPLSLLEVKRISNLFIKNNCPCLTFTGPCATNVNLYKYANQTKILHIATHSENSSLLSSALLFYQSQCYNTLTNIDYFDIASCIKGPEIVVLSSCNTYHGIKYQGEGTINLVRAFLSTGTTYVIYSIFNTEENFANEFMYKVYSRYINNRNIVLSLNDTKREYLNHPIYSNPIFWANFNIIMR